MDSLSAAISGVLGVEGELSPLEKAMLSLLAQLGGRCDIATLKQRLPGAAGTESDDLYQAIAELQAQGLLALSWGQTEVDWPFLRLSRKGWMTTLTG